MANSPQTILALIPNWLGDVAMCTPALRALHRHHEGARIIATGRASACGLLEGIPWIDDYIVLPSRPGLKAMADLRKAAGHPNLAVVFPHSFRAALMARATGARRRLGYHRGGRAPLLTDAIAPYREDGDITPIYMAKEYLDLVAAIGCTDDGQGLELHADNDTQKTIATRLAGDGPLIAIAPGAAFGPSKRWLPERYAAVADALHEQRGARCVLLTGPGEEDTRQAVMSAAKTPLLTTAEGSPTLRDLKATIAQSDLLIGNDSGPRHIAIAFGVPVVCIMGSTSPRYSQGPYEKGRVLRIDVDCGPCQQPTCATDHRCMTGITAEDVTEAALQCLDASVH
jgi:heptosyltransferase-2